MSENGALNTSRDDVVEGVRVLILKNGVNEIRSHDGPAVPLLFRSSSVNSYSSQHGVTSSSGSVGLGSNCDSVLSGCMLRSADMIDEAEAMPNVASEREATGAASSSLAASDSDLQV